MTAPTKPPIHRRLLARPRSAATRWATDWLLAAAFAAGTQLEIWVLTLQVPHALWVRVVASALTAVAACALAVRRSRPAWCFWMNTAAVVGVITAGYDSQFYQWTHLVALYSIAAHGPRRQAWIALPIGLAGVAFYFVRFAMPDGLITGALVAAMWAVGWLAGLVYGTQLEGARLRAERDLSNQLAEARESQLSLEEERSRIAHELHDIIGHTVNVMVVHAGAGRRAVERDPGTATQAFETIEQTGRSALAELDRVLGILRREDAAGEVSPIPSLVDLDALAATFTDAGLPVQVHMSPDTVPADLPSGIGLTAYRIVQEALTNTMKHAEAGSATVTIAADDGRLHARIADDGPGDPGTFEPGRGITGMTERAAIYGGRVRLSRDASGFVVTAELPLDGAS